MGFNTGGFGGGWGGGNRFTAASNPCSDSIIFSGNSAKAPPFSVSSGMSPSPNMFPGAEFPGKRGIFDHPIVQASGIKAPTPLGHDLPSANLSARSSTFGSAPFRASGESHGRAVSVGRDFNPSPSLRPESNV
ncbi:MAG: hypothetical protein LBF94_03360, partial [Puniceicoccales bacterium]|nr:hypothetical protein [Puniceicoccales bacterium]